MNIDVLAAPLAVDGILGKGFTLLTLRLAGDVYSLKPISVLGGFRVARERFMKNSQQLISRRAFAGSAAAIAALAGTKVSAFAEAIEPTAESPVGPFYPIEHLADDDADLTWLRGHSKRALGDVIEVSGRVLDRYGNPMRGAKLEIWQANAAGRYDHANDVSSQPLDPNFQGFAKLLTSDSGEWHITTIKPKFYDTPLGTRTPHIHFDVSGKHHRLIAQMYFPEEKEANAKDFLYKELGPGAASSVARLDSPTKYRWDIILMDG